MNSQRREFRFELAVVFGMNLVFLVMVTPLFLGLGFVSQATALAAAFAGLWLLTIAATLVQSTWERLCGITMDTHYSTYVGVNLVASATLLAGWVTYTVVMLSKAPVPFFWVEAILFLAGLFGSYLAFVIVTTFYRGSIYKVVNLAIALVGYIIASATTFLVENWQ